MRYFTHDLPASKLAALSDVSRPTINQRFFKHWSGWILFWRPPCSGKKGAWSRGQNNRLRNPGTAGKGLTRRSSRMPPI